MRIFLATIAATFLLVAGLTPASAAVGHALVQKPSYGQPNASVEKAGWRHRRHYRGYRADRRRHHHRRWWWWR